MDFKLTEICITNYEDMPKTDLLMEKSHPCALERDMGSQSGVNSLSQSCLILANYSYPLP